MKFILKSFFVLCIFGATVSCANADNITETPIPTPLTDIAEPTATLDLCIAPQLNEEVTKVNRLMREFDDYSTLASNTPQSQLIAVIPELQRVLREAEEQVVPACLLPLKKLQIDHMRVVVQTLLAFIGNSDTTLINTGITKSRELHQLYDIELARLLGITLQVATPVSSTQEVSSPTVSATYTLTNPGPNQINLWSAPSFDAPVSGVLPPQTSTTAFGKTADNFWIQVEMPEQPGQIVWVIASVSQLSVPIEELPVVSP